MPFTIAVLRSPKNLSVCVMYGKYSVGIINASRRRELGSVMGPGRYWVILPGYGSARTHWAWARFRLNLGQVWAGSGSGLGPGQSEIEKLVDHVEPTRSFHC